MRELRAVRVSDDGKEILLTETTGTPGSAHRADGSTTKATPSTDPEFVLAIDDRLRGMLRPRPQTSETRPESALTPREIQSRLRAGDTAEEVARAAGIPVARVARYEAPIAAERVRIVDEVRRATAPGPHRVSPGRQLGSVVDDRLGEDGLDPALAQWLARRQPDNTWMVTVDLADHHAEWSWDGAARRVRAHDSGAQRLLNPSRSSAESLIAVAQAAGVTAAEPAVPAPTTQRPEPHAPLAQPKAVGESHSAEPDAPASRAASRSAFVVVPGAAAPSSVSPPSPSAQPPLAPESSPALGDIPGSAGMANPVPAPPPTFTPSAHDVPGSGGNQSTGQPAEPSASASDAAEIPEAEVAPERTARPAPKSGKRRSAVPAWDDIVFGARRS